MNAIDGGYGTSQLPLAGAILCCTSIAPEQRTQLAAVGAQMGATIKLDLTSDVTHLIVGNTDSAKYRYVAKSRDDVKVLGPEWLEALRAVWMRGDDHMDVTALEEEYRLPTLFDLKICLTGFDDPEQRRHIQETVTKNGAEYHGDLTKSVTHLIAATPSGKKYEHARSWNMKIVSLEWFEQSLERGMVLDEALFNPTLPIETRGRGAWDRRYAAPINGKRTREGDQSQALNPFRRKLRRSASTKFGSQSESLWAGITAVNLERQQDDGDEWNEHTVSQQDESRTHTPASPRGHSAPTPEETTSFVNPADAPVSPSYILAKAYLADGLFQGRLVCPHGFDREKTAILRQHLSSHGARVLSTSDLNNAPTDDIKFGFLIVPHDAKVDFAPVPDRAGSLINIVSNWWVERCLHGKRLVDPADDVLSRPFGKLSVSGFSGLTVNSTGFAGIELLHVTKVVALLGANYDEHLSAKTSVIVCNSSGTNTQKLKFAAERRIPAVTSAWLSDCIRNCCLQPYDDYRFSATAAPQVQHVKSRPHASPDGRAGAGVEDSGSKPRQAKPQAKIATKPPVPRRPRTLELAPSADATPTHDSNNNSPVDQDDSTISKFDGNASLPLQNISANSRRPSSSTYLKSASRARSRSSSAESLIRAHPAPGLRTSRPAARKPSLDSVIPTDSLDKTEFVVPPQAQPQVPPKDIPAADKDYSDLAAQLRANRKPAPASADAADGQGRRRRRQLGRAPSTRSDLSVGSPGNAGGVGVDLGLQNEEEEESVLVEEYLPSQQLGWEEPGAAKAREVMIRRLGGTIKETSIVVQGIGVVTDEGGEREGRGGRKRRG